MLLNSRFVDALHWARYKRSLSRSGAFSKIVSEKTAGEELSLWQNVSLKRTKKKSVGNLSSVPGLLLFLSAFQKKTVEKNKRLKHTYENLIRTALKKKLVLAGRGTVLLTYIKKYYAEAQGIFDRFQRNGRKKYIRKVLFASYKRIRWHRVRKFRWRLFKKLLRRWIKRYRKIQKNRLFNSIFKAMFQRYTGLVAEELSYAWRYVRKLKNPTASGQSAATIFNRYIYLRPELLLVLLGLVPSKIVGRWFALSGILTINGLAKNTLVSNLYPGDTCQLFLKTYKEAAMFQNFQKWNFLKAKWLNFKFIVFEWSLCAFSISRWPYKYEISGPRFLSERWVRYYIRNFPAVRKVYKKKVKMKWKEYAISFS